MAQFVIWQNREGLGMVPYRPAGSASGPAWRDTELNRAMLFLFRSVDHVSSALWDGGWKKSCTQYLELSNCKR